jgi:hypothetical protein
MHPLAFPIARVLKGLAGMAGVRLLRRDGRYDEDGLITTHSDAFRKRPEFQAAYGRGLKAVLASKPGDRDDARFAAWQGEFVEGTFGQWRTHIALWCAANAARLEGDFVECGVFVGFMSSAVMHSLDWNRLGKSFYLIDTFEGPSTEQFSAQELASGRMREVEHLRKIGGFDYTFEGVRQNFREWPSAKLIKGRVPEALADCPAVKIAYLHIDMNCALPEVAALRHFWPLLVPGGHVLLDDYAYSGFQEQQDALNSLASELGFAIAHLPTGQGLIIKA